MCHPQIFSTIWEGSLLLLVLCLQKLHIQIGHYRAHRRSHSCPLILLIILTLEQEIGVTQAKLQQVQNVSCSTFFLVTSNADFTGMEVKRAATSYEMMHSPSSSMVFLMSSANSLELFTWWMVFPVRGFKILANSNNIKNNLK